MSDTRRLVIGRYGLVRVLGQGGFGRVWLARDEQLGAEVVVKEVHIPADAEPDDRARLLKYAEREARHAVRLRDHPNIVTVFDVAIEDGRPWIVMERVDGGSLADALRRGPLPVSGAVSLADSLLRALDAAHRADVVHRDIKPGNVMLTGDGRVMLTDFGIATHPADTRITVDGSILGSFEYMAPERFSGIAGGPAGDMFSLGVTLYEAVEGVSPFRRDSVAATIAAVTTQDPPPLKRAGQLAPLITALLARDPAARPSIRRARELLLAPRATPAPARVERTPAPERPKSVDEAEANLRRASKRVDELLANIKQMQADLDAGGTQAQARPAEPAAAKSTTARPAATPVSGLGPNDPEVRHFHQLAQANGVQEEFLRAIRSLGLGKGFLDGGWAEQAKLNFVQARDQFNRLGFAPLAQRCQAAIDKL